MRRKRERSEEEEEEEEDLDVEESDDASASSSSGHAYSEEEYSEESTSSDEAGLSGEKNDQPRKTVNVAFDFAQPSESDFQPLKALLNSYAPSPTFPLSALVDAVISAPSATVIRASDGDDDNDDNDDDQHQHNRRQEEEEEGEGSVVGVGAVLRNGGSLLRGMFGFEESFEKRLFSDANHVIVIERLMNTPPQLGGPLLGAIFEGTDAGKDDEGKYVVVGRAYVSGGLSGGERAYALPEFGCLAEDGVAGEVVWVDTERGGREGELVRFVAVVEEGLGAWVRGVASAAGAAGGAG